MPTPSSGRSTRTRAACVSILFVTLALILLDAAMEGKKIVLGMLATGGVFIGVIALGQLTHWLGARRDKH